MPDPLRQMRSCDVCGCQAHADRHWKPGEPVIVALNTTIYRRPGARLKRQLVTTRRVTVCESCLGKAISPPNSGYLEGRTLALAIFRRIDERYSAMLEAR